jgi:UPF0755 protein
VKRLLKILGLLLLVAVAAAGAFGYVAWRDLENFRTTPFGGAAEKVVEIAPGSSPRAVVRALAKGGVLADDEQAWRYVRWVKRDHRPFKAGEYAFAGSLTPDEALERIYRGEIKLYRFTVPEGLRLEEIAEIVGKSGLAGEQPFLSLARDPAVARGLGVPFDSLEGYLFPDTYAFARGVTARQIADAMVKRFREAYAEAASGRGPGVALGEAEAVVLASIVEKETGQVAERPRIACVFHNRLQKKMRLQTDPTVMYATFLRTGRWSKNISKADLQTPHPYNTYTTRGLPPGPIASPGAAALKAALAPATCQDLFFVSRNDGTHIFCPDLACHEAAVRQWQVEFFRKKHP